MIEGQFRALIAQLLQVKNFSMGEEGEKGSWLERVTCLAWEAATCLSRTLAREEEWILVDCEG